MHVDLSIGRKIRDRREGKKISQNELARVLGISAAAVCQWEKKGTVPRPKTLSKIAHALGVSEQYLIGKEPAEPPATSPSRSVGGESVSADLDRLKAKIADILRVDAATIAVEITLSD